MKPRAVRFVVGPARNAKGMTDRDDDLGAPEVEPVDTSLLAAHLVQALAHDGAPVTDDPARLGRACSRLGQALDDLGVGHTDDAPEMAAALLVCVVHGEQLNSS